MSSAKITRIHDGSTPSHLRLFVVIFALTAVLVVSRDPSLFYAPRFWAEEGTEFFHTAYVSPLFEALIEPHQGYYLIWPNLAAILAVYTVPIEYAPAVTTWMALLVLLAVIGLILVNEASALDTPFKKAVASLAALVVGATGEIWLTSINSQYYFALIAFLLLIDRKQIPLKRRAFYVVAAIAGLSGPMANFITPLFLLRYWQKRERGDLVLFLIFCVTSFIELYSIVYSIVVIGGAAYYSGVNPRFHTSASISAVLRTMTFSGLGYPIIGRLPIRRWIPELLVIASIVLSISQISELMLFILSVVILTIIPVLSSFDMAGGDRYAYAASVILAMQLLAQSTNTRLPVAARVLSSSLLVVSLVYWSWSFRTSFHRCLDPSCYSFHDPSWPTWSSEVAAWRADPTRKLQVWPIWDYQTAAGIVWSMQLPPQPAK